MVDNSKSIFASKTFWINAVTALMAIITAIAGSDIIPAEYVAYATGLILPILNIVLRFFTDKPAEMRLPRKN